MHRKRRHPENENAGENGIKRRARVTRQYLGAFIAFLGVAALLLMFRVGLGVWPAWVTAYRTELIGFLLLGIVVTVCLYPLIVEANSNTRHLSGPGHDPHQG